jgi:streptomycin 6-kinase
VKVPDGLGWWRATEEGAAWLERLPQLVAECAAAWSLDLGEPFRGSNVSLAAPATTADGADVVLKVNFPDEESEHEADALQHWDGDGAVRLLAHDPERRALLIERCRPGTPLWEIRADAEATLIAARLLRRLRRPAPPVHPYRLLAVEAGRWSRDIVAGWGRLGRPYRRELVDAALEAIEELAPTQPELVVCHQDLHGGNVLRAAREDWLVIDPKPLVGEPAFDAASLLRDRRWLLGARGDAARLRRRLDILSSELALDRERMRRWGIVHALAWGVSGTGVQPGHVESAELLHGAA